MSLYSIDYNKAGVHRERIKMRGRQLRFEMGNVGKALQNDNRKRSANHRVEAWEVGVVNDVTYDQKVTRKIHPFDNTEFVFKPVLYLLVHIPVSLF